MSISLAKFMGGSENDAIFDGDSIRRDKRVVKLQSGSAGADVLLPAVANYALGGPHFFLINQTGFSLDLRDQSLVLIATLAASTVAVVVLGIEDAAGTKQWFVIQGTFNTGRTRHKV